jgi:hypothetical protein
VNKLERVRKSAKVVQLQLHTVTGFQTRHLSYFLTIFWSLISLRFSLSTAMTDPNVMTKDLDSTSWQTNYEKLRCAQLRRKFCSSFTSVSNLSLCKAANLLRKKSLMVLRPKILIAPPGRGLMRSCNVHN